MGESAVVIELNRFGGVPFRVCVFTNMGKCFILDGTYMGELTMIVSSFNQGPWTKVSSTLSRFIYCSGFWCDYVDALIFEVETSLCLYPVSDLEPEILTVWFYIIHCGRWFVVFLPEFLKGI